MFEREDWMLFRSIDSLGQKAGVGRDRIAAVVLKELVDNALDAGAKVTAECEELPGGSATFTVADDGPGIDGDDETLARLFSFRRGLLSSKLLRLPTRGALGNGLRVVMGAVSASGGGIEVSTRGRTLTLVSQPDGTTVVIGRKLWAGTGTTVRLRLGPALRPDKGTLVLARNAIALATTEGASRYTKKSSPHWYSVDAFYELCQGWTGDLDSLVAHLRVKGAPPFAASARALSKSEAHDVLRSLQAVAPKPKPAELGACGPNLTIDGVGTGYAKKTGEFPASVAGSGTSIPFVVEVWAKPNVKDLVIWFANRTPTAASGRMGRGDRGKAYLAGCGINHYVSVGKKPVALFISVTSPWIPITTDGKEPNFEPIFDEIESAVKAACRKQVRGPADGASKADLIGSAIDQGVDKASSGGRHRYSLRQLYYAVRGILSERGVEMPDYGYFSTVVTEIEARRKGDLPGIYRDARGVLYHPHTGEQIPLGTLGVEEYRRREYAFHKVLYIEKGGFLPLLLDAKWPELHDCAILTSQGFASRAARDVIDLLGSGSEPIQWFFCVHDADGPGTLIYEKLKEATQARGARRVEIHNLGLDPWEGYAMGLEAETFERKRGKVPVADYIRHARRSHPFDAHRSVGHPETHEAWDSWLQTNRYELNAMASDQFLKWLDEKIAPFERTSGAKLVPPDATLGAKYLGAVRAEVKHRLLERLAQEHNLEARVNEVLDYPLTLHPVSDPGRMDRLVREHLEKHPDQSWEAAVAMVAARFARDATDL